MKTLVIALGGNAITRESEEGNVYEQFANTRNALEGVADLAEQGYRIAITHGNGPQVGNMLIRIEESRDVVPPVPLGVIVADLEGGMGYMIAQTMMNKLTLRKIKRDVATIVTQVLVDKNDPSIHKPTKFVGPFYEETEVIGLEAERGWILKKYGKKGWRRVVPSPVPLKIIEKDVIKQLVNENKIVIAAGGGGAPVYMEKDGTLEGVDAVIDKDKASAILAADIGAEELIILTATDYVYLNYERPDQKKLEQITVAELKQYYNEKHFPAGSMGPKVEAAIQFIESGGKKTVITSIENTREAVAGKAGTIITN
ncbi:MAG: carbamate kinase [bacterium]|nr:carbamate kinase [bacterium]